VSQSARPLNRAILQDPPPGVAVPEYDRSQLKVGIVHIGVGGFHRAHQAMYLDRLMSQGEALDWAICGLGVLPHDKRMADVLQAQDGLYTLVVKHADGTREPRVVGSLVEVLYAPDDPELVLERLVAESTRLVSLTITEGGYNFNQVTHEFDESNPSVAADLRDGAVPTTVFGYVTEALRRRRALGRPPFTIMSCDNIQSNGHIARRMFTAFARLKDAELAAWVDEHVCFPDSMVDRITPATTDTDVTELRQEFDIEDQWPVVCEPFTQWVLEDQFNLGRPAFETVGVQVVPGVEPYELMKLRLLNASHQALGYLGYLCGYDYVHEAAVDPQLAQFVRAYMDDEATPSLLPIPGVDLAAYKSELLERFSNPEIRDTLSRLCAESSDRIPKWVLPVLRYNLEHDGPISHTTAIVAAWGRYVEGVDEQGRPIEVVDRLAPEITAAARRSAHEPLALLSLTQLFGDLARSERFTAAYTATLERLHGVGVARTLPALNGGALAG
jgi:mannitol 2-dehydrogenase